MFSKYLSNKGRIYDLVCDDLNTGLLFVQPQWHSRPNRNLQLFPFNVTCNRTNDVTKTINCGFFFFRQTTIFPLVSWSSTWYTIKTFFCLCCCFNIVGLTNGLFFNHKYPCPSTLGVSSANLFSSSKRYYMNNRTH